jgi:hypothetical protein
MTTLTPTRQHAPRRRTRPAQTQQPTSADEELRALWTMTAAQRITAMWRGQLTRRQLSKWTSRTPYEVPLLGGEFAWIVMRTPEWAEPSHPAHADRKART